MGRAEMERSSIAETPETEFAKAVAAEIARLKSQGYSNAYICERSFEIEDAIQRRIDRATHQGDFS